MMDPATMAPAEAIEDEVEGAEGGVSAEDVDVGPPPPGLEAVTEDLLRDDPVVIDPDSLLLASDEDILKVAYSRMSRSVAFRAAFEPRWKNAWMDWMLFLRGDSKAWQSKNFIPLVYEQVSSAIPSFVAAIFDSGRLFDVQSAKPSSDKQARVAQSMIEYFLRVKANAEAEAEDWVKYAVLLGTGVMRSSWLRVEGVRREMEEVMVPMPDGSTVSAGTRWKNTHGALIENRPVIETVDLWNWFPAPYLAAGGKTPWAFERVESTVEDLVRDAAAGLFGPDGKERVAAWLETNPERQAQTATVWAQANDRASVWAATAIESPYTAAFQTDENSDRAHAQIVYWVMSTGEYRIAISAEGSHVLGKMSNPFTHGELPYDVYHFDRIPKCPFGRGVGEIVESIQRQVNFNYNKGNDAAQLAITKPMKLRGAGNAGVTVVWQPGVIVRLRDTSDLEPLDVKNPMGEVVQMEAHLIAHADKATGLNDLARGSAQGGINTATESANVQSQFRMRMSGHARNLRGAWSGVGRKVLSMLQQFIDAPTAIQVTGDDGAIEWETVEPKDLVGEFHVVSTVNFSKSNPAMVRQDLVALAPHALASPVVNQIEFMKRLFQGFEFDHIERLLVQPPPPERDPALEEMALKLGMDVVPSPMEVMTGGISNHLAVHLAEQAAAIERGDSPKSIQARMRHIEATMSMKAQVEAQGAPPPGSGAPPPAEKAKGGDDEARRGASRLGQAAGAHGPPGQSPGPQGPPRRPSPQNPVEPKERA